MAFPFRMTFSGLCALVPNTNGMEGRVLLVDASIAKPGGLDAHFPWLKYQGYKHSLTRTEVTLQLTNPQPPTLQLFLPSLPSPFPPGPHLPKPQTDEERAVFWIADIDKAGAALKPDCLAINRPPFVTSRIKLTAGHMSTSRVIEDPTIQSTVRYFRWSLRNHIGNPIPDFDRAMAAQFSLNAMIDGGKIMISNGTTLTLQPTAGESVVEVGNTCSCIDPDARLEDFGWFYELSTSTIIFVPVRGGTGVTDTMCPPTRFAANPNA